MKILFCSQWALRKTLGGPKVIMELADAMRPLGWECDFVCPQDFQADASGVQSQMDYAAGLRRYLQEQGARYDVIDYDHLYLPYPRTDFDRRPVMVARSVLMAHHFEHVRIPTPPTLRGWARSLVKGRADRAIALQRIRQAQTTLEQADLINVMNGDDKAELLRHGLPAAKITVQPGGISAERRVLFDALSVEPPAVPTVAFVGTFDYRKGGADMPSIVARVVRQMPEVRFKLLGCLGRIPTESALLACFPAHTRRNIDIVPKYNSEELPGLLASCSVGMFPSYVEGFGFGVLEMMAAAMPVVAYRCPGPPEMVPDDLLVSVGDAVGMSAKLLSLLSNRNTLKQQREAARKRSQRFAWETIARDTSDIYRQHVHMRNQNGTAARESQAVYV